MISKFFIERPVLANVLAILMVVIGAVSLFSLPVAQYPNVVPPTVQVTTRYPGASARTVIDTVALPIEQQVNGVENMLYMQSYAGRRRQLHADRHLRDRHRPRRRAGAGAESRRHRHGGASAIGAGAGGQRPEEVDGDPADRDADVAGRAHIDSLYLSNYATIRLKDEIARLPGVGNVNVFGAGQYSMRIWLDPEKMRVRGLTAQDVVQALQQQSEQVTAGQVGMPPAPDEQSFQYTIKVSSRLDDPDQFAQRDRQVRHRAATLTRVRDVGRVELGAQTYSQVFKLDGRAGGGPCHLPVAGSQRARRGRSGRARG